VPDVLRHTPHLPPFLQCAQAEQFLQALQLEAPVHLAMADAALHTGISMACPRETVLSENKNRKTGTDVRRILFFMVPAVIKV
jgi:hypothetical protein